MFGGAWFTGFIEYVSEAEGGEEPGTKVGTMDVPPRQSATVSVGLSHQPGCLSHYDDPGFNHQAIAATATTARHESYSYHFVAPSANFTDAVSVATQPAATSLDLAGVGVESFRSNTSLLMPALLKEIPVLNVTTGPTSLTCHCKPMVPGGIGIYFEHTLAGATQCGGGTPVNFTSALAIYQQFVGEWSAPAGIYPFKRKLWTNGGTYSYADIQCAFPSPQPTFHFTHGISTLLDSSSAVIELYGTTGAFTLAMDFTNSLTFDPVTMSQSAIIGIETQGIASWHLNK